MKEVLLRFGSAFPSAIVFLVIYLVPANVVLATSVAIAGAIAQAIRARLTGKELGFMSWASLGLVIVLGSVTILTRDPRFVLAKPSIAHFAIGTIMLKRGWMLRYVPPIVVATIPEYVTVAGYAWAALMFALGAGTIAAAATGDLKLWAFYVSFVLIGAKLLAFAIQYVVFRQTIFSRVRAARVAPAFATLSGDKTIGSARQDALYDRPSVRGYQDRSGSVNQYARGELGMAVDGNWNLTMSTPMGERNATLSLKSSGGTLTGTHGADGNSTEIFDGSVSGDDVTWKVSITNPMPLTLDFTGTVAGDSISGEMCIGPMGSFPFTGKRA